jgi:hypothetical protein
MNMARVAKLLVALGVVIQLMTQPAQAKTRPTPSYCFQNVDGKWVSRKCRPDEQADIEEEVKGDRDEYIRDLRQQKKGIQRKKKALETEIKRMEAIQRKH